MFQNIVFICAVLFACCANSGDSLNAGSRNAEAVSALCRETSNCKKEIGLTDSIQSFSPVETSPIVVTGSSESNEAAFKPVEPSESGAVVPALTGEKSRKYVSNEMKMLSIAEKDLIQQRRMAIGTFVMAITSVMAIIVSGVGIWFLASNLRSTNKLINITRSIGETEHRAYLRIKSFDFMVDRENGFFTLKLQCENFGNTVANLPVAAIKVNMSAPHGHDSPEFKFVIGMSDIGSKEIVSSVPNSFLDFILEKSTFGNKYEKIRIINFKIAVFAVDVFGQTIHATARCQHHGNLTLDSFIGFPQKEGFKGNLTEDALNELYSMVLDQPVEINRVTKDPKRKLVPAVGIYNPKL